jgi:hypothetical protein
METKAKRLTNYSSIGLGAMLVMAFVLVQPTMNQASAADAEAVPPFDNCEWLIEEEAIVIGGDFITQNSIKKGNIVKTIHAEKEIFICFLTQGNIPVIVDVTTYAEVYEHITNREVLQASALVTTCLKSFGTAEIIGCESYVPSTDPVPVGSNCEPLTTELAGYPGNPMEMDTVRNKNIVKTIETQKEIWFCDLPNAQKKVDIVLFQEVYEDIDTREVLDVQFHQMRCVVLITDASDDLRDGTVESCIFSTVPT